MSLLLMILVGIAAGTSVLSGFWVAQALYRELFGRDRQDS